MTGLFISATRLLLVPSLPQEQAVAALQAAGGNVEAAAAVLTFGADAML